MTQTELWVTYILASRAHLKDAPTTQLVELEFQNHKLTDLEDVLDHELLHPTVFRQGYVEAKHRSATWWETKEGVKVRAGAPVEEVLHEGVGSCPETSLRLVVQDVPNALWFTYVYKHNPTAPVVTQRIKLPVFSTVTSGRPVAVPVKMERLAHLTNYIFKQGYVAAKYRTTVHWEGLCGKKIEEGTFVEEVLEWGVGGCEDKPLRLVIDAAHPHPTCDVKPGCPVIKPIHEHSPIYEHHHHHHAHSDVEEKHGVFHHHSHVGCHYC